MTASVWTPAHRAKLEALLAAGGSNQAIAARLGRTTASIRRAVIRFDLEPLRRSQNPDGNPHCGLTAADARVVYNNLPALSKVKQY